MDLEPRETSDLLSGESKETKNGSARVIEPTVEHNPPDGGVRAYSVLVASFLTNGLLFGQMNSCGTIYEFLKAQLAKEGVANGQSRATLVGSLAMGVLFLMSPVSGILTSLMGLRLTAVLGGLIAATGLVLSSFLTHNVDALIFTYGIMYGLGASFAYTPSLAILGHYFKKHLGIVNGIVTVGSSVFTVIMTSLISYMLTNYSLEWLFRLLALFTFGIALCGLLFKPVLVVSMPSRSDGAVNTYMRNIFGIEIWKNRTYRFWALSMPVALFGYLVPYIQFADFVKKNYSGQNTELPVQCMAVTSGLGRLAFGWLADKPNINRIFLQQISFYVIGLLTMILPFVQTYWLVIVIALGMGLFDGAFISLIGPIAFELCGSAYASQAIGCMLGLAAVPLSIGPLIAAEILARTGAYKWPFVLAGMSPLIGATLMFAVRFETHCRSRRANANGHIASPNLDAEKPLAPVLSLNGNKNEQTAL